MDSVAGSASGANLEDVIRIEEETIRSHADQVVRQAVDQTLQAGRSEFARTAAAEFAA